MNQLRASKAAFRRALCTILIAALLLTLSACGSVSSGSASRGGASISAKTTFTPEIFPAHGTVRGAGNRTPDSCSPFEILTSDSDNYYLILKSGSRRIEIFLRGGKSLEVDIPFGSYTLYYTSGQTWYGTKEMFGNDSVARSNSTLEFTYEYGQSVTLYKVSNGNFSTRTVDKSEM